MRQKKIDVIDPDTGEERFVVAQEIGRKLLVKVQDACRYSIMGLTRWRIRSLRHYIYDYAGKPRTDKHMPAYIDLNALMMKERTVPSPQRHTPTISRTVSVHIRR